MKVYKSVFHAIYDKATADRIVLALDKKIVIEQFVNKLKKFIKNKYG